MTILELLQKELLEEAQTTRKMLDRVPEDKYSWKPHEKSMSLISLATHIAELPSWIGMTLNTDELDFAQNPYEAASIKSTTHLLEYFEKYLKEGIEQLANAKEEQLDHLWTLRNGEVIYLTSSKYEVIRMTFCQIVHHRAQLGVYLRLLNIPIPGSYGPSADELEFTKSESSLL
jgi:uncharacterized damage-inducible protein DinB